MAKHMKQLSPEDQALLERAGIKRGVEEEETPTEDAMRLTWHYSKPGHVDIYDQRGRETRIPSLSYTGVRAINFFRDIGLKIEELDVGMDGPVMGSTARELHEMLKEEEPAPEPGPPLERSKKIESQYSDIMQVINSLPPKLQKTIADRSEAWISGMAKFIAESRGETPEETQAEYEQVYNLLYEKYPEIMEHSREWVTAMSGLMGMSPKEAKELKKKRKTIGRLASIRKMLE